MLTQTRDADKVREALKLYPLGHIDLDVDEWTADPRSLTLEAPDGSLALFEWVSPGLYDGHYFFKARGKEAFDLANEVLDELPSYGVKVVRGFTPVEHKAALWMSRRLGFREMGEVPTDIGPCVLFVMNLDERKGKRA